MVRVAAGLHAPGMGEVLETLASDRGLLAFVVTSHGVYLFLSIR